MANVARVEATITAQNKLRPGLSSAARDLDRFRNAQTKAASAFARTATQFRGLERMERVAGTLSRGAAALGGAFALNRAGQALKEATVRFADVDRAMTRTGITGDATAEEVRKGTEELRNLARQTATMFDPAQKGLDAITASGREFGEAMKMMPSVLRTAQASGAGVEEIANSSTALLDHMKISVEGLQEAQDTLAKGGKLGKFELKDMARYLPSMLPAFKALGAEGQSGLRSLVAMLQVIRAGTGTAEEAAASASNIFQKMESEETTKKFKKFGIDLTKEMAKARKEGRNLSEVFVDLSAKALKGDLSKLPQLFTDMEFARGMRALIAGRDKYKEYVGELGKSSGTIATDLKRVTEDAQANIDRLREGADRAKSAFGGLAAELGSPLIKQGADNFDALAQSMERATKAAREGGIGAAVKQVAGDVAGAVANDLAEGRQNMRDLQQRRDDEEGQKRLADPKRGGWFDWLTGDTSRQATQAALDKLLEKEKRGPLNPFDRRNKASFQERLAADDNAWSRDQTRRVGPLPAQVTSASPDFADAIESAREARRAGAFSRGTPPSHPFDSPLVAKGQAQRGRVVPPRRPGDIGATAFPAYGSDDDGGRRKPGFKVDNNLPERAEGNAASNSLFSSQPLASQSLDPSLTKTSAADRPGSSAFAPASLSGLSEVRSGVEAAKASVESLGSAGSSAGQALANGLTSSLAGMEAQVAASVARMQAHLDSLKAPSLSVGGLGGFNTGKGMGEVR
jgi:TP901 family phage tail tape measure protein